MNITYVYEGVCGHENVVYPDGITIECSEDIHYYDYGDYEIYSVCSAHKTRLKSSKHRRFWTKMELKTLSILMS